VQDTDPAPTSQADIPDWLRLAQVDGVGCLTGARLVKAFGSPGAVLRASRAALAGVCGAGLAGAIAGPADPGTAELVERTLDWLAMPGHHILTLHDPAYPPLLKHIHDPPLLLYAVGRIALLSAPALAIVGSRSASQQGKANARAFGKSMSDAGLTVVSGLALGIDAAAHEGALAGAASTVAVIGTGIDIFYPLRNLALAQRIGAEGCVISEYPLGHPVLSSNFPRRNRIISGLSKGVLVVEAAAGSGSLITARMAAEQGREVFAIPGSIHAPMSKGCHKLLREGAKLVECSADVLEELQMGPAVPRVGLPPALDPQSARLLAVLGHDPVHGDALALLAALEPGALSACLLTLELAGHVEKLPGGLFQRINH
jgi:DNA processing protein